MLYHAVLERKPPLEELLKKREPLISLLEKWEKGDGRRVCSILSCRGGPGIRLRGCLLVAPRVVGGKEVALGCPSELGVPNSTLCPSYFHWPFRIA